MSTVQQADLFSAPSLGPFAGIPIRRKPLLTAPPAFPLAGTRDAAQFVRSAMKLYYDAMRSEASCRSTAKRQTLTGRERLDLLERADHHRTRAEWVILAVLERVR